MAIIVDELTPEEVYERFQNNSIRRDSFTIYGIEAIFEYFETVEIDTEYEFFNTITWDSLFFEKKSAIELLQSLDHSAYDELEEKYSDDELEDECFNYIEENYRWCKRLENNGVIVYDER